MWFPMAVADVLLAMEKTIYNFEPAASGFYLITHKERCADCRSYEGAVVNQDGGPDGGRMTVKRIVRRPSSI
jgi:hypothetical protein